MDSARLDKHAAFVPSVKLLLFLITSYLHAIHDSTVFPPHGFTLFSDLLVHIQKGRRRAWLSVVMDHQTRQAF